MRENRGRDLNHLQQRLWAIHPDLKVRSGYQGLLWLYTREGAGALRLTLEGDDLAPGPLRRLGLSAEQRRAVAQAVRDWREPAIHPALPSELGQIDLDTE